jgi:hypothetical protein
MSKQARLLLTIVFAIAGALISYFLWAGPEAGGPINRIFVGGICGALALQALAQIAEWWD